jgi:hypothetical protein
MHHISVTWMQGTEPHPSASTTYQQYWQQQRQFPSPSVALTTIHDRQPQGGGIFLTFPPCFRTCHDHSRLSLAFCFTGGCIATASRIQAFSDFIIITMGRLSFFHCHLHYATMLLGWLLCFLFWAGCLHSRLRKVSLFPSLH